MKPVIFFDVDGTIVDTDIKRIPDSTLVAINDLQSRGYLCCIATGRGYENLKTTIAFDAIEWDGYICSNGQEVLDENGKYIYQEMFSNELASKVVNLSKELNHPAILITKNAWNLSLPADDNTINALTFLHEPIPEYAPYTGQEIMSFVVFADIGYDYVLYKEIEGITVIPSYTSYADIILSSASKAIGIKRYLESKNKKTYVAFGDSMNDYEMLKHADHAIMMGQGDSRLKEVASYITKSVGEDGIKYACDNLEILKLN